MSENLLTLIIMLSPVVFTITAIASWFQPGFKPKQIIRMSKAAVIISMIVAAVSGLYVYEYKLMESELIGIADLGFSLRLDAVSMVMLTMISLLGFIIIKFSVNYLDGDQKQGAFFGRLSASIASVQLLVLSGNLGLLLVSWILTSICLHRLLLFYPERPGAQLAARKKFIVARAGDACLLAAIGVLYYQFDSGNLEVIFEAIKSSSSTGISTWALETSAILLTLAAVLKSAQFPTHGWLIEVMETPTPVSALLHAGLLNAGPFLIIRMAFVMNESTIAPILLIGIGGLTALFASVAYLTQPSVKTALGYSSVGHMGFSLLVCGMGVYSAAMLHLVAHSFYKAHAFLSSGSVIDIIRGSKVSNALKSLSPIKIASGFVMALALYIGFAMLWGVDPQKELSLLIIGAVIVMGLARIVTYALTSKSGSGLIVQAVGLALLVTAAFFSLEAGTHYLLSSQVPDLTSPGLAKIIAGSMILLAFGLAVLIQILSPQVTHKPHYLALSIHIRNGFYANAIFDKLIDALDIHTKKGSQALNFSVSENTPFKKPEAKELKEQLLEL